MKRLAFLAAILSVGGCNPYPGGADEDGSTGEGTTGTELQCDATEPLAFAAAVYSDTDVVLKSALDSNADGFITLDEIATEPTPFTIENFRGLAMLEDGRIVVLSSETLGIWNGNSIDARVCESCEVVAGPTLAADRVVWLISDGDEYALESVNDSLSDPAQLWAGTLPSAPSDLAGASDGRVFLASAEGIYTFHDDDVDLTFASDSSGDGALRRPRNLYFHSKHGLAVVGNTLGSYGFFLLPVTDDGLGAPTTVDVLGHHEFLSPIVSIHGDEFVSVRTEEVVQAGPLPPDTSGTHDVVDPDWLSASGQLWGTRDFTAMPDPCR